MSETSMLDWIITGGIILAKVLIIVMPLMLGVAYLTYAERKIIGYMQLRIGPNRVGPRGWLQPIADAVKLMFKEIVLPTNASRFLFLFAPILSIGPALAAWAVIPFDRGMVLTDIDAGLLYILALTSIGVYGVIIAGWASNSKYAILSSLRVGAQIVAYEIAMGFALVGYAANETAYFGLTVRAGPVPYADLVMVGMFDILAQALIALAIGIWLLEEEREQALDTVEERRRRERAQACVYRISDAARSVGDLPELFRTIHMSIGEVLPARNFYIALFDPAAQSLSVPYFVEEHDSPPSTKRRVRLPSSRSARTRATRLAVLRVSSSVPSRRNSRAYLPWASVRFT